MKIKTGIIGGAGYTGGELIRLLVHHPDVEIVFVNSRSQDGKKVSSVHHDLTGDTDLSFSNDSSMLSGGIDVLFLCAGHNEARKFMLENQIADSIRIIDLSQDFRLGEKSMFEKRQFVYGLPELNKEKIRKAMNIANPGCFATAIQLGLLPLSKAGLLNEEIFTTGITGSTGAGQGFSTTSHFSWRANNIQPYKTLTHQHLYEISESLQQLKSGAADKTQINFVPWRGDFTRGILITSMLTCEEPVDTLVQLYHEFYQDQPFTHLSPDEIALKQVGNTNKCMMHLEKIGSKLVIHSVIDNLLKGASGQAVQNMNLMFGIDEKAGLNLKATAF